MRAIKFRAWNGYEMIMPREKSYYQHYMSFCGNVIQKSSEIMDCFGGGDRWHVVNDLQLMQFTGLLDKNGVEIYEGDIVEEGGEISAIEWFDKHACFGYKTKTTTVKLYCFYGVVIGNIHETPELLK